MASIASNGALGSDGEVATRANGAPFSIRASLKELTSLGVGTVLYFRFHDYLSKLLLLFCFWNVVALSVYHQNVAGTSSLNFGHFFDFGATIGDILGDSPLPTGIIVGDIVCSLLGYLTLSRLDSQVKDFVLTFESSFPKASDYTIRVEGLPKHDLSAEDVKQFFSQWGEVVNVVCPVGAGKLIDARKRMNEAHRKIRRYATLAQLHTQMNGETTKAAMHAPVQEMGCNLCESSWAKRFEAAKAEVEALSKRSYPALGIAFVTFQLESSRVQCLRHFEACYTNLALGLAFSRFRHYLPKQFKPSHSGKHYFLCVTCAPDPRSILWENLEYGYFNRVLRRLVILFVSLMLTLGNAYVIYIIRESNESQSSPLLGSSVAALTFVLWQFIRKITPFEKCETTNAYEVSLMFKRFWLSCLNSSVVVWVLSIVSSFSFVDEIFHERCGDIVFDSNFVVRLLTSDCLASTKSFPATKALRETWYGDTNLFRSLYFTLFFTLVFAVLNQVWEWSRFYVAKRLNKCMDDVVHKATAVSPGSDKINATDIHFREHPSFSPAVTFVKVVIIFGLTVFSSAAMPSSCLMAFIFFVFWYWLVKFNILRVYARPPPVDQALANLILPIIRHLVGWHVYISFVIYFLHLENVRHEEKPMAALAMLVMVVLSCVFLVVNVVHELRCFLGAAGDVRHIQDMLGGTTMGARYTDLDLDAYDCPVSTDTVCVVSAIDRYVQPMAGRSSRERRHRKLVEEKAMYALSAVRGTFDRMFHRPEMPGQAQALSPSPKRAQVVPLPDALEA